MTIRSEIEKSLSLIKGRIRVVQAVVLLSFIVYFIYRFEAVPIAIVVGVLCFRRNIQSWVTERVICTSCGNKLGKYILFEGGELMPPLRLPLDIIYCPVCGIKLDSERETQSL